jgi:hypothetical protein
VRPDHAQAASHVPARPSKAEQAGIIADEKILARRQAAPAFLLMQAGEACCLQERGASGGGMKGAEKMNQSGKAGIFWWHMLVKIFKALSFLGAEFV